MGLSDQILQRVQAGDPQAVSDDVGRPNAPAVHEGYSLYAKASVSY